MAEGAGYRGAGWQLLDMNHLVLVPGSLAHLTQKGLDLHGLNPVHYFPLDIHQLGVQA